MSEFTPEFQNNLNLLKTIPSIVEVTAGETDPHLEQQLSGVDCYRIFLTNENGKSMALIVPKVLCNSDGFELNDELLEHFQVRMDAIPSQIRNEYLTFFVDPVSYQWYQLDGRKVITNLTEKQQLFVDYLMQNVEGCLSVTLSTVVDPDLIELTVTDEDIFMHYRVAGFIHPFGMIIHESNYKDESNFPDIAKTMAQDIFKAATEKL